jgi:hypothetical protein
VLFLRSRPYLNDLDVHTYVFHVPDVGEEKAVDILINNKCEESLAKEIAKLCDG